MPAFSDEDEEMLATVGTQSKRWKALTEYKRIVRP